MALIIFLRLYIYRKTAQLEDCAHYPAVSGRVLLLFTSKFVIFFWANASTHRQPWPRFGCGMWLFCNSCYVSWLGNRCAANRRWLKSCGFFQFNTIRIYDFWRFNHPVPKPMLWTIYAIVVALNSNTVWHCPELGFPWVTLKANVSTLYFFEGLKWQGLAILMYICLYFTIRNIDRNIAKTLLEICFSTLLKSSWTVICLVQFLC